MGVILTNILAQIPYYGTPLVRQWGGEDVSQAPIFDAYFDAVGSDRDNLLLWGHTGFLGAVPFIHKNLQREAAKMTALRPRSEKLLANAISPDVLASEASSESSPVDVLFEQLEQALEKGNILIASDALDGLSRLSSEQSIKNLLYQVVCDTLDRHDLQERIDAGNSLGAYFRSQIGLSALHKLFRLSAPFPEAGHLLDDIFLKKSGVVVLHREGDDSRAFTRGARVESVTHPAVAKKILEMLLEPDICEREETSRLLKELLRRMDYKLRQAKIFDVTVEEAQLCRTSLTADCIDAVYAALVKWGMGDLFLQLVDENPETAVVAFHRHWDNVVLRFESVFSHFWVMRRVRDDPQWAYRFCRINQPKILDAVWYGLREALNRPHFEKAIEVILSLGQDDRAVRLLVDRYKELYDHPETQNRIADAMEEIGDICVLRHFEAERSVLWFWEFRKRRKLTARINRTKKSKQ